jgi:hypothetical protein
MGLPYKDAFAGCNRCKVKQNKYLVIESTVRARRPGEGLCNWRSHSEKLSVEVRYAKAQIVSKGAR